MGLGAVLLIGGVYTASFIGQGLASPQMYELRSFLDSSLEAALEKSLAGAVAPTDRAGL